MHISPFEAFIPDLRKVLFDEAFYMDLREDFNSVFEKGLFKQAVHNTPGYYVLEIKSPAFTATGLVCLTSIEDYKKNKILKHEQTIAKKERIHRQLLQSRNAMIKPAALLIHQHRTLQSVLEQVKKTKSILKLKFPDPKTIQTLWPISDPIKVKTLTQFFLNAVDKAVIADGHHRFASLASRHSRQAPQQLITIYFTPDEMHVSTFHRIITPLKSTSPTNLFLTLKSITTHWQIVDSVQDQDDYIHLIFQNKTFRFKLKTRSKDPLPILFSHQITKGLFQINDESKSKRIQYVESTENPFLPTDLKMDIKNFVFILPPLTTHQVLKNKKLLPPKSTLFTPRIINGLIIAVNGIA